MPDTYAPPLLTIATIAERLRITAAEARRIVADDPSIRPAAYANSEPIYDHAAYVAIASALSRHTAADDRQGVNHA